MNPPTAHPSTPFSPNVSRPRTAAAIMHASLPVFLALIFITTPAASAPTPQATNAGTLTITMSPGVAWWAGVIQDGHKMPLAEGYSVDVNGNNFQNQVQSLLLSSKGDVVWSESPFRLEVLKNQITVESRQGGLSSHKSGNSLREAFLYASKTHFPPSGQTPDELLFSSPQYNTWIELMYEQSEQGILRYARGIKEQGFPAGVLMIDDNWQEDYGKWDFSKSRFSDPKGMIASLHRDGFKVMLWVCPFVSADSEVYRDLARKGLLMKDKSGEPAIVRWWNGASALLDFTNPGAADWFRSRLDYLTATYGVDGFKFDGGDSPFYVGLSSFRPASPNEHTMLYGRIGLRYPLNEYRAMWQMGGMPLAERLSDKAHSWTDLRKLVPDMILEGLMGYPFSCPDMIGGGEFTSFLPGKIIDQDLIVRSTQCQALMPMMQFSVAPWRVLDADHLDAVHRAVKLRETFKPYILKLVHEAATTGEPIVRSLEYVSPHQGYERVNDQFLLGDRVLVAPVLEKGMVKREVVIPAGTWKGFDGKSYQGPSRQTINVPYNALCYFEKLGERP